MPSHFGAQKEWWLKTEGSMGAKPRAISTITTMDRKACDQMGLPGTLILPTTYRLGTTLSKTVGHKPQLT